MYVKHALLYREFSLCVCVSSLIHTSTHTNSQHKGDMSPPPIINIQNILNDRFAILKRRSSQSQAERLF